MQYCLANSEENAKHKKSEICGSCPPQASDLIVPKVWRTENTIHKSMSDITRCSYEVLRNSEEMIFVS
jgi:hypothetical protein